MKLESVRFLNLRMLGMEREYMWHPMSPSPPLSLPPSFADCFPHFHLCTLHDTQTEALLSWADTLSNVHTPTHAAPPTLLEDGQCYRGNQFKQGLDGREVVRLAGKDMHHLKEQDVTSDTPVSEEEVGSLKGKEETVGDLQPVCVTATRSDLWVDKSGLIKSVNSRNT